MPPLEHFHDKEDYRKWLAYRHLHHIPSKAKEVSVAGRTHKVDHATKRKTRRKSRRR